MNMKLEAKRMTRWLVSSKPSAEVIGGEVVATAHEDNIEAGHYISNFKWCVREVCRLRKHAVIGYTKKVGEYCAVYANLSSAEVAELRAAEVSEEELAAMIAKDRRAAA